MSPQLCGGLHLKLVRLTVMGIADCMVKYNCRNICNLHLLSCTIHYRLVGSSADWISAHPIYLFSIMWWFFPLKRSLSTRPTRVLYRRGRLRSLQFTPTVRAPRIMHRLLPAIQRLRQAQECHNSQSVRKAPGHRVSFIPFGFLCNIASAVSTFHHLLNEHNTCITTL